MQHKRTSSQARGRVSGADTEPAGLSSPPPPEVTARCPVRAPLSQQSQASEVSPAQSSPCTVEVNSPSVRSLVVIRLRPPPPNSSRLPFSFHVPGAA